MSWKERFNEAQKKVEVEKKRKKSKVIDEEIKSGKTLLEQN